MGTLRLRKLGMLHEVTPLMSDGGRFKPGSVRHEVHFPAHPSPEELTPEGYRDTWQGFGSLCQGEKQNCSGAHLSLYARVRSP